MQKLDGTTLYEALSKIFDIELESDDFLKVLGDKYHHIYSRISTFYTTMVDEKGNNIVLSGPVTNNVLYYSDVISLSELKKILENHDFVILEKRKVKYREKLKNPDPYEDFELIRKDLSFNPDDEFFSIKVELLARSLRNPTNLKKILDLLKTYIDELGYQAKSIIKLDNDNKDYKHVCAQYRKAYESNFNKNSFKIEKKHRK